MRDIEGIVKRSQLVVMAGVAAWLGAVLRLRGFRASGALSFLVGIGIMALALRSLSETFADPVYR